MDGAVEGDKANLCPRVSRKPEAHKRNFTCVWPFNHRLEFRQGSCLALQCFQVLHTKALKAFIAISRSN